MWSERADSRAGRANLMSERANLRLERADQRFGGKGGTNGQTNERTKVPCVLQDFVPFGAAAQKACGQEQ